MDNIRLYTCMVGKKPTHANFYVDDVSELEAVVTTMAGTDAASVAAAAAADGTDSGIDAGGAGGARGVREEVSSRVDASAG